MRFFSIILVIVSLYQASSHATTGTLKGIVNDGESGMPIAGAVVWLTGKKLFDTTDADGSFQFTFPLSAAFPAVISPPALVSPHYIPGRGIVFANKTTGNVKAELFNLSGKRVTVLCNSILERGIQSIPLYNCANGLYLCRLQSYDGECIIRFIARENGKRHTHPTESESPENLGIGKIAIAATAIDTLFTSKSGYGTDTLIWSEKTSDSVIILLLAIRPIVPQTPVRSIISFDKDWLFSKGTISGAETPAFSDASWRSLNVPHDWSIEGPFDEKATTTGYGAYLPAGIGWYRKHFTLPTELSGRRIFIEFDGIMANSTIYMNGTSLGTRPFGYISFRYEITNHVTMGAENVVAVAVDNSAQPASRWYSGAGIYGHVRLIATNPVHIDK